LKAEKNFEQEYDVRRDLAMEQLRKELQEALDDFPQALEGISEKERKDEDIDEWSYYSILEYSHSLK